MREATIIRGSENIATNHAYTEIIIPVLVSEIAKSAAMSVSRLTGMNSEVLNTNAENVRPSRDIQPLAVILSLLSIIENPVRNLPRIYKLGWKSGLRTAVFLLAGELIVNTNNGKVVVIQS